MTWVFSCVLDASFEVFVAQVHHLHPGTNPNKLVQILVPNGVCCHINHQNTLRELSTTLSAHFLTYLMQKHRAKGFNLVYKVNKQMY